MVSVRATGETYLESRQVAAAGYDRVTIVVRTEPPPPAAPAEGGISLKNCWDCGPGHPEYAVFGLLAALLG